MGCVQFSFKVLTCKLYEGRLLHEESGNAGMQYRAEEIIWVRRMGKCVSECGWQDRFQW